MASPYNKNKRFVFRKKRIQKRNGHIQEAYKAYRRENPLHKEYAVYVYLARRFFLSIDTIRKIMIAFKNKDVPPS